ENVEAAELGQRALDHSTNRLVALDVERDAEYAAALARELAAGLGVARGILARHDNVGALGQELRRAGAADADGRAGDDGDAVCEAEVHVYTPLSPSLRRAAKARLEVRRARAVPFARLLRGIGRSSFEARFARASG